MGKNQKTQRRDQGMKDPMQVPPGGERPDETQRQAGQQPGRMPGKAMPGKAMPGKSMPGKSMPGKAMNDKAMKRHDEMDDELLEPYDR